MPWKLAIIGMGPRGLSLLDRLTSLHAGGHALLEVHVFEAGEPGCGVHVTDQPHYLLTNTVCSQITAFGRNADASRRPLGCPSFFEWARNHGEQVADDEGITRVVMENDYLPRAVLGRYLSWAYSYIVRNVPDGMSIVEHRQRVGDVIRVGHKFHILGEGGAHLEANGVAVCTGHSLQSEAFPAIQQKEADSAPYPISRLLQNFRRDECIAVEGMGLTALDVISSATVGRGGTFTKAGSGALKYEPSGEEPRIISFSRSGMPLLARARNQKCTHWNYQPSFASLEAVERLRMRDRAQIDFEIDLLPLVEAEMELVYYTTFLLRAATPEAAQEFAAEYRVHGRQCSRYRDLTASLPERARWSLRSSTQVLPREVAVDSGAYRDWLLAKMKDDVAEARLGNLDSPFKAACDVLRDIRPTLRHAVNHAGLTPGSHQWLLSQFMPVMNRLAVGPPLRKIEEFIALIEAGVVDVATGPVKSVNVASDGRSVSVCGTAGSRRADRLIRARISQSGDEPLRNRVIQSLLTSGTARTFSNGHFLPGGLDVDSRHRLVGRAGSSSSCIWALGTPVEGPRFYTFVLSAPDAAFSPLAEAQSCAEDILQSVRERLVQPAELGSAPQTIFEAEPSAA